jgi:hypothetical protein
LENIRARAHFLILLTPTALERCGDPEDWLRREIEAAIDSRRNIVPVMLAGFDFGAPAIASQLTGKLAALKQYNGLPIPKGGYFSPAMERLRKFLSVSLDRVLHPASLPDRQNPQGPASTEELFVSYARDDTTEGKEREAVVDRLCAEAEGRRAAEQAAKADAPREAEERRRREDEERDPSRWQSIRIAMSGETHERSLSFTVSGLARAEGLTIAADLDLVTPFVRRATRTAANDESATSPGRALFELLWPAALKDQSADGRHRRLILDERSASFPWELLDDRRPWLSEATEIGPPALRAGMVRELLQTRSPKDIVAPRGKPKALIVGNPKVNGFRDLPGATQETTAIAGLLKANDRYDVAALIGPEAGPEAICRLLFTDAWEIIHISAPGVLNQMLAGPDGAKRRMTGIALGGGVVLGPSALSKLPVSPKIIFVNCCHLGRIDLDGRPEFAANVVVELVKLGARCVIAPGWAVDDKVAAVFAERFYKEMLDGATFGISTWEARKAAYAENPKSSTWGAYQCYGAPDYRLGVAQPGPN